MIALYDHIQELRLELRNCYMTPRERRAAEKELSRARAEHARLEAEVDEIFETEKMKRG